MIILKTIFGETFKGKFKRLAMATWDKKRKGTELMTHKKTKKELYFCLPCFKKKLVPVR